MRSSGKRLVLGVVAALLSGAAALAIGILLFGDFGTTEGRILASTALLAGYGLLILRRRSSRTVNDCRCSRRPSSRSPPPPR